MIELPEQGDLPDGGGGQPLVHGVYGDSLQGDCLLGAVVDGSGDHSVGPFADCVQLCVVR